MKSISVTGLWKLFHHGIIGVTLYWRLRKLKKIKLQKQLSLSRKLFCLSNYNDFDCISSFRFSKVELLKLVRLLRLPRRVKVTQALRCSGMEGFCILLRRMAYPNRLSELAKEFCRSPSSLSRIIKYMTHFIYTNHRHRIETLDQPWLIENLANFSLTCLYSGSPFQNLVGFIDGTSRPICRSSVNQRDQYSGYKKMHVMKYQSVVMPNGLIGRLDGPFNGRRHDAAILHLSGIIEEFERLLHGHNSRVYTLYGDLGYSNQKFIKVGFRNFNQLSDMQKRFNATMSMMRVGVEYGFGKIVQHFAFLDYKKNQKLLLQPLNEIYKIAAVLVNCQCCLRGNQVADLFGETPPTLQVYLAVEYKC